MNNVIEEIKTDHLTQLSEYRRKLFKEPKLRHLFLELTLNCNERCLHCGSSCGETAPYTPLTVEQYKQFLDKIKQDFGTGNGLMLCVTGGEPLLRKEFFEIMGYAASLGFNWGMTSNATLIDKQTAKKLKASGMKTISVSIDGTEETHDNFRRTKGGYKKAMEGIQNLIDVGGFHAIQVTTVVTHESIKELDDLFSIFENMDIDSWRIINLEPIGRAKRYPELLLTPDDYRYIFDYIKQKRNDGYPVTYGCSHYLGIKLENEVRDWYFLCNAGIYTASVMANGDIAACLDIERRPELIQGNILKDDFTEIWKNRFRQFRDDSYRSCEKCDNCSERKFCGGDSFHTWNFNENRPDICFKDILF